MPGRAIAPFTVPADLWRRPETLDALRNRDIGRLFRLLRQYAGASQTQIAIACGMTQGKVSETMKPRGRRVTSLEVFERIADGLDMPDHARMTLGPAPRSFNPTSAAPTGTAVIRAQDEPVGLDSSAFLGSLALKPHAGKRRDRCADVRSPSSPGRVCSARSWRTYRAMAARWKGSRRSPQPWPTIPR